MSSVARACAYDLLDTAPVVMRFIRGCVRNGAVTGLTLPQFRALNFVGRVSDCTLSAAAEHLGLSLPAMSRLVNGLVGRGWVERRQVLTNRRRVALALTAAGRLQLETARERIRRHLADVLCGVPAGEQAGVRRALRTLRAAFEAAPATAVRRRGAAP